MNTSKRSKLYKTCQPAVAHTVLERRKLPKVTSSLATLRVCVQPREVPVGIQGTPADGRAMAHSLTIWQDHRSLGVTHITEAAMLQKKNWEKTTTTKTNIVSPETTLSQIRGFHLAHKTICKICWQTVLGRDPQIDRAWAPL